MSSADRRSCGWQETGDDQALLGFLWGISSLSTTDLLWTLTFGWVSGGGILTFLLWPANRLSPASRANSPPSLSLPPKLGRSRDRCQPSSDSRFSSGVCVSPSPRLTCLAASQLNEIRNRIQCNLYFPDYLWGVLARLEAGKVPALYRRGLGSRERQGLGLGHRAS